MNINADSLSIAEAAEFLGVPPAQLIRWAQQGVGPKFEGHALRPDRMQYGYADLIDWRNSKLVFAAWDDEARDFGGVAA